MKTREFSALRANTRSRAMRGEPGGIEPPTLTGHLMEVPRAMIRLENAEPGSLGSTIVAARLPSRAHDATDPADRRTAMSGKV